MRCPTRLRPRRRLVLALGLCVANVLPASCASSSADGAVSGSAAGTTASAAGPAPAAASAAEGRADAAGRASGSDGSGGERSDGAVHARDAAAGDEVRSGDPQDDPNPWLRARLEQAGLQVHTGPGSFYEPPSPLPPAAPGTIIRVQTAPTQRVTNADIVRVMYHSQARDGHDVAVTGTVTIPQTPAPAGGRPVIAWAHGTTGIGAPCAPSKETIGPDPFAQHHVDQGYVWAATDYYGLGPPGLRHPYLSGVSEAHAVTDIVRAARAIPLAGAGTSWVVYGHSQGGQAALFTGEIAPAYAPELHLLGTVSAAPAVFLPQLDQLADGPGRTYVVLMLLGLPTDYPTLHADEILTQEALTLAPVVDTGCGGDIAVTYKAFRPGELVRPGALATEPLKSILRENDPGRERTDVPVLLTHGADDLTIPATTSQTILERLCGMGQVVARTVYDRTGHSDLPLVSSGDFDSWIAARFAGAPAPTTCPR